MKLTLSKGPFVVVLLVSLFLLPQVAQAQIDVAVGRGEFKLWGNKKQPASKIEKVRKKAAVGVSIDAGCETAPFKKVDRVARKETGRSTCAKPDCLKLVADKLGVDLAIAVSVVQQKGIGVYLVTLHTSEGQSYERLEESGLAVTFEVVRRLADRAVVEYIESQKKPAAPLIADNSAQVPDGASTVSAVDTVAQNSDDLESSGLPLVPFGIAAAVTGLSGIGTIVLMSIAHKKGNEYDSIPEADRQPGDKSEYESYKLAGQVFLGATIAAAVTAAVLFPFTRFKSENVPDAKRGSELSVAPVVVSGGGGVSLGARF